MLLLDTDVMIDLLRQYPPAVAWLDSVGDEEIALPGFVVMELIQGCRNKQEQDKIEAALAPYRVVWPSPTTCDAALSVFARYYLRSR
jgi:predicted nucleic acid-binding protein